MDTLLVATILAGLVLLASVLSVELGISVAIIEISLGVLAGNFLGVTTTPLDRLHRRLCRDRPDLPGRSRGRSDAAP